ncbi:MAG: hypothetical protein R8K49_09490 [Mariprofundaceae bacterium]
MQKYLLLVLLSMALNLQACSSMHDGKGWNHMGDKKTHQDSQPYVFEHKH